MLGIGGFSLATGLSITALRHYDDVGLLVPASVDPETGYRRYRAEQVAEARMLARLRGVGCGVEAMRAVRDVGVGAVLAAHRDRLRGDAGDLARTIATVERYLEHGMPTHVSRISQVTIIAPDLPRAIAFYRDAFDAEYHEEISSFQFGVYPDDDFFLLTVANPRRHAWSGGPAKFGLLVDDVDAAHARALGAGGREVAAPVDRPWKPRSSTVADPAGNHIDLYAA